MTTSTASVCLSEGGNNNKQKYNKMQENILVRDETERLTAIIEADSIVEGDLNDEFPVEDEKFGYYGC